MTKAQCIAARDDREMMLHEDWWPKQFPVPRLHLKHRKITVDGTLTGMPRTAIMTTGIRANVEGYHVHQYDDTNPLEFGGPPVWHESVDSILADGWQVD